MIKAEMIKQSVAMTDILKQYGFEVNRAGFMNCPFHQEKTASLKIYSGDRGWHCFGCGANGDVIAFVQKLFNLNFAETLRRLDADFALNLYGETSFEKIRQSHRMQQSLQAKRDRLHRQREQVDTEYWEVFDEWKRLDDNRRNYAPKTPDEEWHPLYIEALQKIAYQEHLLDCAEKERWKLDNE